MECIVTIVQGQVIIIWSLYNNEKIYVHNSIVLSKAISHGQSSNLKGIFFIILI